MGPLGAPSLSKEVCPPGLRDSQVMGGQGQGQLPMVTTARALLLPTATEARPLGANPKGGGGALSLPTPTRTRLRQPPSPACSRRYCGSSRGPFSRGSTPFRPTLLLSDVPR